jgi:hypothetical protein
MLSTTSRKIPSPCWKGLTISALVFLSLGFPLLLGGQTRKIGSNATASCRGCRIQVALSVTLERTQGDNEIARAPRSIVLDRRGNIIVARGSEGTPLVFDKAGRFLRAVGRKGDGPGEFREAELVVLGPADSIFVIDRRLHRLSVLAPDWQFVRSAPFVDGALAAAWTPSGLVTSAEVRDRARFGKPLHLMDPFGNYLRSFGETGDAIIPGRTLPLSRLVASSLSGDIWSSAATHQYLLERWSADGQRLLAVRREAPWFSRAPADARLLGFTPKGPAYSFVYAIAVDDAGHVWTNVRIPDARWRDAVRWNDAAKGELASIAIVDDLHKAFDTVFEVFDRTSGDLLATFRSDVAWHRFAGPNRVVRIREDPDGIPIVELHEIRLVGSESTGRR